jgi:hypothetical protein
MEKPPVGAGTFCPLPMLVFYNLPCRQTFPTWRNVKYHLDEGQNVPAPTGGFFTPKKLQFSRGELNLINFCYKMDHTTCSALSYWKLIHCIITEIIHFREGRSSSGHMPFSLVETTEDAG